jgi:hypothetical protein
MKKIEILIKLIHELEIKLEKLGKQDMRQGHQAMPIYLLEG